MSPGIYWTVLRPEIALLAGAVLCLLLGVAKSRALRALVAPVGLIALLVSMVLAWPQLTAANVAAPAGLDT